MTLAPVYVGDFFFKHFEIDWGHFVGWHAVIAVHLHVVSLSAFTSPIVILVGFAREDTSEN